MKRELRITELMESSTVTFGTSGARGLAEKISDLVAYAYTTAFLQVLESNKVYPGRDVRVFIGGDLRPSTNRIMRAISKAVSDYERFPVSLGHLPSPALAHYGIEHQVPTVMVTGSHIPDDRNGIKYTTPLGEISKEDECQIREQIVLISDQLFDNEGSFRFLPPDLEESDEGVTSYINRYLNFFQPDFLSGKIIGLYQHSAVGRDIFQIILEKLGAKVVPFGRSELFIPVDTEAIRMEDQDIALEWALKNKFDAIVSSDGDSDRPLISDEYGNWLRGDVAGILTASFLGIENIATPVSCNTAVEKSRLFKNVIRTKIGSPFVIAGMEQALKEGDQSVAGYEANGGFLTATDITLDGRTLSALPTRDAVIVHLALLGLSIKRNQTISQLSAELPQRFTLSDRLKKFSVTQSRTILEELANEAKNSSFELISPLLDPSMGQIIEINNIDGLRLTFTNNDIIHFRPSGNAPEFRCYVEASTQLRATELLLRCIEEMESWRGYIE